MFGVHEGDVFVYAASSDVAFVARLGATEPGHRAPAHRADVEVIAVADDPDGDGTLRSVPSRRSDAICSSSAVPLLVSSSLVHAVIGALPFCQNAIRTLIASRSFIAR